MKNLDLDDTSVKFTEPYLPTKSKSFLKIQLQGKKHLLIVSTYNSINLLSVIPEIDLTTHDESHMTVSKEFSENILKTKNSLVREYFFTATRKIIGTSLGMNDTSFYGNVIYDASPREMLVSGDIVRPKIHFIDRMLSKKETDIKNIKMLVKNTIEAFIEHKKLVKKNSLAPEEIGATLLISFAGIDNMELIYNDDEFKTFAQTNNIKTFCVSSKDIYIDWNLVTDRDSFDSQLKNKQDNEDSIICNVDMLTEGIDLPGVTGCMPMKDMNQSKLMQLLGRSLRLLRDDRYKVYKKAISPSNLNEYIKPYGWLVIPRHLSTIKDKEAMEMMVREIMKEFKSSAEEIGLSDDFIGSENDLGEGFNNLDKTIKGSDDELNHSEINIIDDIIMSEFIDNSKNFTDNELYEHYKRELDADKTFQRNTK